MGLRFRKTISILPGVRLNLGKSSASVSVGVPGFRKTFNTKGQVTTTVGVPGTGLYYVDTKNPKKQAQERKRREEAAERRRETALPEAPKRIMPECTAPARPAPRAVPRATPLPMPGARYAAAPLQVTRDNLISIHKSADDTIDWNEVRACPEPPDPAYNPDMWAYYHSVSEAVLGGDIDTYLTLIYEVNPLDDLLDYGSEFEFGTDDPSRMEIEFTVNESALLGVKATVNRVEYNDLLQDFICSTAIRIARDIFALLPVESAVVHAQLRRDTVLSVAFDRPTMSKVRFGLIDPSDVMARFRVNMDFDPAYGFNPVNRLE